MASLTIAPTTATPGSTVDFSCAGLVAKKRVKARWSDLAGASASGRADSRGAFGPQGVTVGQVEWPTGRTLLIEQQLSGASWTQQASASVVVRKAAIPPEPIPTPPANAQAACDNAQAGSTVILTGGVYTGGLSVNKPLTVKGGTFSGQVTIKANSVTLDGVEVRNVGAVSGNIYVGAIDSRGWSNVTLKDCYVHDCTRMGVWIENGADNAVIGGEYARCQPTGIHPHKSPRFRAERVHTHHHTLGAGQDAGWEAGGIKVVESPDSSVIDCDSHDNAGPGIWFDVNAHRATITGNKCYRNGRQGIHFEISSGATIQLNAVWECGFGFPNWGFGAGILISSASGANVTGNVVARCADGIVALSQNRGGAWNAVSNVRFTSNDVIDAKEYLSAFMQDFAGTIYTGNNGGSDNRYFAPGKFAWNGDKDLAGYNATPGEENGRYLTPAEKDAVLAAAGIPA